MHKLAHISVGRFPLVSVLVAGNALLVLAYIALIAVVMSYAALQVASAQSVRSDEAAVAKLESQYFDEVGQITHANYQAEGYNKPIVQIFVPGASHTAVTIR